MEGDDEYCIEYVEEFASCKSVVFINEHEKCQKWMKLLLKLIQTQLPPVPLSSDTESVKTTVSSKLNNAISLKARHHLPSPAVKVDTSLHTLLIVNSHLKDITLIFDTLYAHPKLINLNLSFNSLREVPSLLYCNMLQIVDVSHNRLQSLDFVLDCMFLKVLRCHHNNIESLMPLENHSKLEEVWLSNNKIDWTQFMYLQNSKDLGILIKTHNPCEDKNKCHDFILNLLPSLHCLDGAHISSEDRHADDVDLKVMLTQARAQLKREHSSQNLSLDYMNTDHHTTNTTTTSHGHRSHSAKTSRGDHSHTPDGRHSASSSQKPTSANPTTTSSNSSRTTSSLKQLQKKQSNSTQNLHQHFEEAEGDDEDDNAAEGQASKITPHHTKPNTKKKSVSTNSTSKHANKSLSDVNSELDVMLKDMQAMGNKAT